MLLHPLHGQAHGEDAEIVLTWDFSAELPPSAYYVVSVAYSHLQETWYDEIPWTREKSWVLTQHKYLLDLCDDGWFWWSVQVFHQTGVDADSNPVGVAISSLSEVRSVRWVRAEPGSMPGPGTAPAQPTTPKPPTP